MTPKKKSSHQRPAVSDQQPGLTRSVSVRIRADHLVKLDEIAAEKGTIRAAQIQTAIAEYIERRGK